MRIVFILIFIAVFSLFDNSLGYTTNSAWWTHLSYNFQHANLWHLLLNSLAFYYIFGLLQKVIKQWIIIAISLPVAIISSLFATHHSLSVVGASGMIFAMTGMLYYFALKFVINHPKSNKTGFCVFSAFIVISLAIGFFHEYTAGWLHLLCFLGGFAVMSVYNFFAFVRPNKRNKNQ